MKEKDYMECKIWSEKAGKLKANYKGYEELRIACIQIFGRDYFGLGEIPSNEMIYVDPHHVVEGGSAGHTNLGNVEPFYKRLDNGKLERFETKAMIKEIAPLLVDHVDREALINDVLVHTPASRLKELYERMVSIPEKTKKVPSIKQKPGCLFLSIGGKPGQPFNLFLRD